MQLQPMVLESQHVTLPTLLPVSLRRKVIYQRQASLTALKSIFYGVRGLFSSSTFFSGPPSLVGVEHHSITTLSSTLHFLKIL